MRVGKSANNNNIPDLTREQLDCLHDRGIISDWVYSRHIGEEPIAAFNGEHKKIQAEFDQKKLEKQVEAELKQFIDKTLDDLLKDFNF